MNADMLKSTGTLIQYDWCPNKKITIQRQGHTERRPYDNKGRNWSAASASPGMSGIAGKHQEVKE